MWVSKFVHGLENSCWTHLFISFIGSFLWTQRKRRKCNVISLNNGNQKFLGPNSMTTNPIYNLVSFIRHIFSRVLRDSTPRFVGPSVRPLVRRSVGPSVGHTLIFLGFWGFWHHCSCPNDLVTSITAPAHLHATGVAVYPALLQEIWAWDTPKF